MARILIVDDEANIRTMVRIALQKDGHTVDQAADGPDALAKFGEGNEWDLVLLDQRMPGMEGLEVLRTMRRRDTTARVVMITAFGTIDLAVEAMKAGATDFLRKPFTLETLRGAAKVAVEGPAPRAGGSHDGNTVFAFTTLNGFQIESRRQPGVRSGSTTTYKFAVRDPGGRSNPCAVVIPAYVAELVKAHCGREELPGGDRFWQGFCEEALANYVWQHASLPPGGTLQIEEYSGFLRRWTDTVLAPRP